MATVHDAGTDLATARPTKAVIKVCFKSGAAARKTAKGVTKPVRKKGRPNKMLLSGSYSITVHIRERASGGTDPAATPTPRKRLTGEDVDAILRDMADGPKPAPVPGTFPRSEMYADGP